MRLVWGIINFYFLYLCSILLVNNEPVFFVIQKLKNGILQCVISTGSYSFQVSDPEYTKVKGRA